MGRRIVLGLFAHPDDETFGPGATLARLAAEGHPVHLFCATRGDAGTIGISSGMGRTALAALREGELLAACRVLGLRPPEILTLPDGGLARLEPETLQRPMVRVIRAVRPEVLITFHADGISGHLDHRTVTARTLESFDLAARENLWPDLGPAHAPARVWVYSIPQSKADRLTARKLHAVPDAEVDAELDVAAYVGTKRRAVAAHGSQKPFIDWLEEQLGGLDEYWARESFILAAARTPLPDGRRPVDDLFAGLP